ncbi:tyrosine-type recombinase/integrase [Teichococcus aestuarii]|uniref:tyrosine-type recombinase/integrase n=1 Tax=Teichococcus aestuarii TaxID=568898 RepID=UPI0036174120
MGERKTAQATAIAAETSARRQKVADALTVEILIERWAGMALKDRRPAYSREAVRALRVNLPDLLPLPAAGIDHEMAQRSIDAVALDRGETMARRSHAYARALYGWAMKRRLVPTNPFAEVHTEGREVSRDRALSDAELREVWQATASLGLLFGSYFRILILTLQRRSEVAGMRWSELSPDLSTWTVPAQRSKNGRAHRCICRSPPGPSCPPCPAYHLR